MLEPSNYFKIILITSLRLTVTAALIFMVSLSDFLGTSELGDHAEASIAPPNNIRVPVSSFDKSDITYDEANLIVARVVEIFKKDVASYGAELVYAIDWDNDRVNAFADRYYNQWKITLWGGLIRHPKMTADVIAMVACHEIAHHIGGAPKKELLYASAEAQADYWASHHCFKKYLTTHTQTPDLILKAEETARSLPRKVDTECRASIARNLDRTLEASKSDHQGSVSLESESTSYATCIESVAAGIATMDFLNSLRRKPKPLSVLTPDTRTVARTNLDYPSNQCRLDTFFAAAKCHLPMSYPLDQRDELQSGCMEHNLWISGLRPACWYLPFSVYPH